MAKVSDTIDYVSIYFVMGEAPQGWTRNAIKDPASGGWSNAFIIRREGYMPKIFVPYSLQSWSVPEDCYELERTREPIKELDKPWMLDCLVRNLRTYSKISGHTVDVDAAIHLIEAMGFEVPPEFVPQEEEKPVKEKKAKAKSPVREARTGLTSVAQIAEELGIVPRVARGYLRAAKIDKPAVGWAGDQAWADMIREALKAEMSKEKPVKVKAEPKAKPEPAPKAKAKKAAPKPVKKAPAPAPKAKAAKKPAPKKPAPVKKAAKAAPKKKGAKR